MNQTAVISSLRISLNHRLSAESMVEDDIANQAAESVGINEMTILAILGIVLVGVVVRFLTMTFATSLLTKIVRSKNLRTKTVKQSDKALGSAVGAGVSYLLALQLVNSVGRRFNNLRYARHYADHPAQRISIHNCLSGSCLGIPLG